MDIQINYDGVYATILNELPNSLVKSIQHLLTYKNEAIAYQNTIKRFGFLDEFECLMLNREKFYTGLIPRVSQYLKSQGHTVTLKCNYESGDAISPTSFELPSWLWDHQRIAIEKAIKSKRGVLVMPTGSGCK
jgi:hypothetical protein